MPNDIKTPIEIIFIMICQSCANEIPDGSTRCAICSHIFFPEGISLRSVATERELSIRLDAIIGCDCLKLLGDADIRFVSSEQFKIEKRIAQGGWAIVPISWAKNPVYLNGEPIALTGVILKDGDKLSIKDKFFRITVRII